MSNVILPRIARVTLIGFQPLFERTVELRLPEGPFLILGGNTMGKTTTIQAIIYALAGGADDKIHDEKHARWDSKYFTQRLNPNQNTEIRVEFALGRTRIGVRRGTNSDAVLGVQVNDSKWTHDGDGAAAQYEQAVIEAGGYENFSTFRFFVHRVCYLPETRQTLVWDQKAQTRAVMQICSDPVRERHFRDLNKRLREIDTQKRHLHVDIGHLEARIRRLEEVNEPADRKQLGARRTKQTTNLLVVSKRLNELLASLTKERAKILAEAKSARLALVSINNDLESFQEKLAQAEDNFILRTLRHVEENSPAVALQKLLVYHRCPYCSQQSAHLASAAATAVSHGDCPICHQPYMTETKIPELSTLRSQVSAGNMRREKFDQLYLSCQERLAELTDTERNIRTQLEQTSAKLPRIPKEDVLNLDTTSLSSLRNTLTAYQVRHTQLENEWQEAKQMVDGTFTNFLGTSATRLQQLQKAASDYGEAFLGYECEFVAIPAKGELGDMTFFVPKFADMERTSPDACSESERFFLDIGFRMALLELAGNLSDSVATFLCETPESALDLAYTDNVANMFARFADRGFAVCLTANIQISGIAKPLLHRYSPAQRRRRVFDLLQAGHMSKVQEAKLEDFTAQMKNILGEE